jgi:hypothetical protein
MRTKKRDPAGPRLVSFHESLGRQNSSEFCYSLMS